MTKFAQKSAHRIPLAVLSVLAMMWVLAVPAQAHHNGLPVVTMDAFTSQVAEGAGPISFRLIVDHAQTDDLEVSIKSDRTSSRIPPGWRGMFSQTIPAGQTEHIFRVPTLNDATANPDGTVTFTIDGEQTGYQVGNPDSVTVEVVDDDNPITLSYLEGAEMEVVESDGEVELLLAATVDDGKRPGTYEFQGMTFEGQSFSVSSSAGTAESPGDFQAISEMVFLPAESFVQRATGDYVATFSMMITIVDDDQYEGESEQFKLLLERTPSTDPTLLTLPSAPASIVITDDDPPPMDQPGTVSFSRTQPYAGWRFQASLSDPDGDVANKAWVWSRASSAEGPFTDISGAANSQYTPRSSDVGKYLKATVTYSDGQGTGKSATAVSQRPVRRRGC